MKRIRKDNVSVGDYFLDEALESYYSLTKKTIREYVDELGRYCRYKSIVGQVFDGTVLDDRSRLIDLYDSCLIQDAHLKSVIETLESNMIGERYMLANHEGEKWIRNDKETEKIFIIPMHYEIAKGTLKSILEQADIELEEFLKLL